MRQYITYQASKLNVDTLYVPPFIVMERLKRAFEKKHPELRIVDIVHLPDVIWGDIFGFTADSKSYDEVYRECLDYFIMKLL